MPDKKKNDKSPSMKELFNNAREINKKEQLEKEKKELETKQIQLQEEEKQRESYAEQLYKDKINILKSKQKNDDVFSADNDSVKVKYTLGQKIANFFYHNKWWLGIGCFLIIVLCYIVYDIATSVKPDMTIMLLVNDEKLYENTDNIQQLFGGYASDRNGDGEVNVAVIYMPISDYIYKNQPEMYTSSTVKLAALLQSDSALIVIADDESSETFREDKLLLNLDKYYPDNENVIDTGFYISETAFAEKIGYDNETSIADDVYIGIRKVQNGVSYENSMRENFNKDFEVLQRLIEDFS